MTIGFAAGPAAATDVSVSLPSGRGTMKFIDDGGDSGCDTKETDLIGTTPHDMLLCRRVLRTRPPLRRTSVRTRILERRDTSGQEAQPIMVQIKTPEQIAKMREAGLVVAAIHAATREAAVPGASTKDLDEVARKVLAENGAKSNFLGYGGFPATICTSVNDVVVHGIPSEDVVLKDGDIISIDCGAIVDGWHGDAAYTAFVGSGHAPELVELSRVTEESMWAGVAAMKLGNRLVDVSRAIETYIRRQPKPGGGRYGIIEDYGGHGIGTEMHMDPHLLNYVDRRRGKGPKLVPGFCLAIEPMVSLGTPKTEVLEDDWTVITTDGTWSSHWEHSVALTEQGPLVLTAPDGGKAKLAEYGVTAAPDPLG